MRSLLRRSVGFTLLEILIVLALSSALLVFVAPNLYRSIAGTDLPTTSKTLAAALKKSRFKAINSSRPASLILNVDKRHYQLNDEPKIYPLADSVDLTLLTGKNLVKGGAGAVFFYPDGSSSGGLITLQQGQRRQQIDINWLTGEVNVNAYATR